MNNHTKLTIFLLLFAVNLSCIDMVMAGKPIKVRQALPNSAEQGQTLLVTIQGSGFETDMDVLFLDNTGESRWIYVDEVLYKDSNNLDVIINVDDDATVTDYDIELRATSSGRGGKGTDLFSVKQKGNNSGDTIPPGPIEGEVRTQSHTYNGMVLHWVAPGDDGSDVGTVHHYDNRRTSPVLGAACQSAPETLDWVGTVVLPLTYSGDASTLKAPFPAHSIENLQVLNLKVETCYDFRIEAFDEAGNTSGPTYTTGTTTVALEDSPFGVPEVANVGGNYFQHLAVDPIDGQPAFLISDYEEKNSRYAKRLLDGTWTEEIVQSNKSGSCVDRGVFLTFSPQSGKAEGLIRRCAKGRNREVAFVERETTGNWIVSMILPDSVWKPFPFAYDMNGLRFLAFDQDQIIQLLNLDDLASPPEVVSSLDGHSVSLKFNPLNGLPAVTFESGSTDGSNDYEDLYLAEFDGSNWNAEIYNVSPPDRGIDSNVFDFDPNGEPMALSAVPYGFFVSRRNAQGAWEEASAPLPTIHAIGSAQDIQIRDDGTVFVLFQNGTNLTVGRLCESGRGFACEIMGVWPELDTWIWETVTVVLSGISTGATMDLDPSGLPAVGWGNDMKTLYAHCQPGISRVCEPNSNY